MKVSRISLASLMSLSLLSTACEKKDEKVGLPEQSVLNGKVPEAAAAKPAETAAATNPGASEAPAAPAEGSSDSASPSPGAGTEGDAVVDTSSAVNLTPKTEGAPSAPTTGERVQLSFPGAVSSQRRSTLSFRVAGFVESVKLKAGNSCKKGATLATLDSRDYKLAVDMAKSNLEVAKVAARNSESEFKRETELKAQNASSESSYDRLKAGFENSKAQVQLAELNLTKAQQALSDTVLKAPYDCVISKQVVNVGESVKVGDHAFEIYDVSDVEVSFNVPERMAGRLKIGEKIDVRIPATGYQGSLDIIRVVAVVDDKTRTFQIVAQAPKGDARVVPGLYAEGIIR